MRTPSAISHQYSLKARADGQQDLRHQGQGLAEVAEDLDEARDDEGQEEHHRAQAGHGEQDRIDEGGHERFLELLRFLEELGEPLERGLEHAALLARTDHVDGQAREGTRLMLGHGLGERAAAADALQEIARRSRAGARWGRRSSRIDQRAVEGQPGLDEGRELLKQRQDLDAGDAAPSHRGQRQPEGGPPLVLGLDLDGKVSVALEPLDDAARVGRLHDAVDGLPLPVRGPVRESRHAGVNLPE